MEYTSCDMINKGSFVINSPFENGEIRFQLCCEALRIPNAIFEEVPEFTMQKYIVLRSLAAKELMNGRTDCAKCIHSCKGNWEFSPVIQSINLSLYPSPCQSRCIYCNVNQMWRNKWSKEWNTNPNIAKSYNKIFETLDYGLKKGFISEDASWTVASGEITIHPYKNRIYDFVRGKKTSFLTNVFVYDEEIAHNLSDNPESSILLSIDAGLPETWYKIKGVNNFDTVTDNLVKYYKSCSAKDQIRIKYIVLPGINDTYEDYASVVEIMKVLEVSKLYLSRDTVTSYSLNSDEHGQLMASAAFLVAICQQNQIKIEYSQYSEAEKIIIEKNVKEIIEKNMI
ncbi:MAG: radical SAM protein [Oscillospiraceae bacterium]